MLWPCTAHCLMHPLRLARNCTVSLPLARSSGQFSGWGLTGGQVPAYLDEATLHQAALYVHWPFCERRCTYCNFNKYISPSVDHDAMRDGLLRETETLLSVSQVKEITSIFFGGGTPSLARPSTIARVLETVARVTHVPHDVEISMEANPTSAAASRLAEFKEAGITRLSLGVQALCDSDLRILGRDHTAQEALRSLEEARKLFPGNTSIDIIFGRPGQSVESWEEELEELVALCDHHVSLYQLTLERGTALYKQVQEQALSIPEQEELAEMYQAARRILGKAGFLQYEVSNFAKSGAVCEHNLGYWRGRQYLGVGPGAHGRFIPWGEEKSLREARIQTLEPDDWLREVRQFGHGTRKRVQQTELDILEELLVLGLRMNDGITHQLWLQCSPGLSLQQAVGDSPEVKQYLEKQLLVLDNRGLRCSWEGLALLDMLLPALLLQLQLSYQKSVTHSLPSTGSVPQALGSTTTAHT
ncbi:radical S-adenosyl methionine domain-containing protein 1, mitochondrial isoform X1 [Chiloscyllium plagiosum]|uniref:radical S-adenosyl methionine domain-containing protein 1, mitochondrial isoform X1 n=1 Tax=Chiloscyllium plagiosum TaxID=36176 RepID=UPI001CB7E39A|nr:radical S-adenosyl methionine domain-containing protein 1, mitochondrial isoform X1 [Chiloscyllium plagiosum]